MTALRIGHRDARRARRRCHSEGQDRRSGTADGEWCRAGRARKAAALNSTALDKESGAPHFPPPTTRTSGALSLLLSVEARRPHNRHSSATSRSLATDLALSDQPASVGFRRPPSPPSASTDRAPPSLAVVSRAGRLIKLSPSLLALIELLSAHPLLPNLGRLLSARPRHRPISPTPFTTTVPLL